MLSREKEANYQVKVERNNHVSSKHDIKNTSTKLVMLNPSENKIREQNQRKDNSTKEYRCCDCLSKAAPACACHHRDKDLSQNPKIQESCIKEKLKKQKDIKTGSGKSKELGEREPKWPSLTKSELLALDKMNRKYQMKCVGGNCCHKDLYLLSSIPALSHPDFTIGQKQCLLSLAKIYTNVSPGPRYCSQKGRQNQSKLAPLSHRSSERKSRSKTGKNVKTNKSSNSKKRKRSLPTAVNLFQSDTDETHIEKGTEDKSKLKESRSGSCVDSVTKLSSKPEISTKSVNCEEKKLGNDRLETEAHESIQYSDQSSRNSNSTPLIETELPVGDDRNEIYELELSNTDLDFILTCYVNNIIQQQASFIRLQSYERSSEMSFANPVLENEGLVNNVNIFHDQNIPDDLLENSKENRLPSQREQIMDKEFKEMIHVNAESVNKDELNETDYHANYSIIEDLLDKDTKTTIDGNEDAKEPLKQNSNVNSVNSETISTTGSSSNTYSNNLEKINPEIETPTENPLRLLSNHLRQSISS